MYEKYRELLTSLAIDDPFFSTMQQALLAYDPRSCYEEMFSWISTVLALKAANLGNLGVGAILVRDNEILYEACNEMLHPYFRSDGHPEMMVLSAYEKDRHAELGGMKSITMYGSLEPCPMCTTRISTTSLGRVAYVAGQEGSGMAHCIDKLPVLWQIWAEGMIIEEASCSPTLKKIAFEILEESAKKQVATILAYKEGSVPEKRMSEYLDHL